MNLDELQSIRDRERQSDTLQQLRDSFYADVGEFVEQLRAERDQAAANAEDPFGDPEVNRLSDDIDTAEQTVEAVYERRVGKLVKMASFAAADMPTQDEGLTTEERALFEDLVASIEQNREQVFDVLDGAAPGDVVSGDRSAATGQSGAAPADGSADAGADDTGAGVDAADLMGSGTDSTGPDRPVPPDVSGDADASDGAASTADETASATDGARSPDGESQGDSAGESRPDGGADVERTTVRITRDVGEIFGVDERAYDLSSEDVVTLPAANADPLVERDAAERID